jgi:tetratricopeptide (TPR) repeat protein
MNSKKVNYGICILLLCLLFPGTGIYGQRSAIREESRSVLTYPFSDPNPVPVMAVNSMVSPFYPYFVFDGYTDKGNQQQWKVISLYNDFINVTVLPEVGGKVWGAIEKSTGLEFVYQNHVMKFRAIGIRGPWTSGGIEHNFGLDLGHAPWTASPVDYIMQEDTDGSVSCTVGGLDLASRIQWRVKIRLPADKAFFETSSILYNPTPLRNAYLSWENGGFKASDDLQFFFPGDYYIGHDGLVNPWPIDSNGRDLSWYRNNNFGTSKSYHVSGYYTGWFGGYWHDEDFGFGHSAPYSDVPGKKIWIWSLARDGAIWEDLLTDSDGQYIEAQSGVKFNQANRESGYHSPYNQLQMRPLYTDTKTEYWFPVVKTGGMADASRYGTLNVTASGDSLTVTISPNAFINDSLVITMDEKKVFSTMVDLRPATPFIHRMALKGAGKGEVIVRLGNGLLSYNSQVKYLAVDRPSKTTCNKDFDSAGHLFLLAEDMNAMRDYNDAASTYQECLDREPDHSGALTRMAELCLRKAEYSEGLKYAEKVLENNTYDGPANFVYGILQRKLGNLVKAEEALGISSRSMEYRSASFLQIAGIMMQKHDFAEASVYAGKALDFNRLNIPAMEYLATCYRHLHKDITAKEIIKNLLDIDPLNHYARFEQYLLEPEQSNLESFRSMIRNELPFETYLEIASEYLDNGLEAEAVKVLEQSPPNPVAYYWLAYLNRNDWKDKSRIYLGMATELSPYLVFPHRSESIPILSWALEQNDSWKSKYYLGLIYWHLNSEAKAAEMFERCGDIPDYAPFYISRGILFRDIPSEYCHPCNDFSAAVKADPKEWRTWHYLISFQQSNSAFREELENARMAFRLFRGNPVIETDYAKALLNSGYFSECIKILEKVKILPQEGAHEVHDIFELANLSLALEMVEKGRYREAARYVDRSREWPENLGAGKPYEPDNCFQDYICAACYEKMGMEEAVRESYDRIINYAMKKSPGDQNPMNLFLSAGILTGRGRKIDAERLFERWKQAQDSLHIWRISSGSSSPEARWLIARHNGDDKQAAELEGKISSSPYATRFRLIISSYNQINKIKNGK